MKKLIGSVLLTGALLLAGPVSANAQATRTWVSGTGSDSNPCSNTAPCKTFAGAISKTAAKGEINVLDAGGFGAVTITKPIAIISESVEGGVLVSGTNAIVINLTAPLPTDTVYLRGLNIDGVGTGLAGVKIVSAGAVHINNSLIRGFKGSGGVGISVVPSAVDVNVLVSDTRLTDNITGVLVQPSGGHLANVTLDHVTMDNHSANAIESFTAGAQVFMNNCVATGNFRVVFTHSSSVVNTLGNNVFTSNTHAGSVLTPLAPQ